MDIAVQPAAQLRGRPMRMRMSAFEDRIRPDGMHMKIDELESDWPAISALLDEALALPAAARSAWLEARTDVDPTRRSAVEQILSRQADVESDDFLGTLPPLMQALPPASAAFAEPDVGTLVGPWRIIAPLGQGGMSTVWRARRDDARPAREIALKLPHWTWGGHFAERLARERDILATLEHTHIARLYDAGLDASGRPWLAMELVEGQPIDLACERSNASVHERVVLLLQVCEAVAHAHARLVVHRDLKPHNIVVTPQGHVKLLDFGIARLIDNGVAEQTALTEVSGRALTPAFASPEQIRGEPLGVSTDVYSIGVVAFLVLTGRMPYQLRRGSVAELEEAIARASVPRMSDVTVDPARRRELRGDLDAIIAKALRKDSAERYSSVEALADDLRRHLDGHPVTARPPGRAYLAARFVARHRAGVGAAALGVLALTGGLGAALWQAAEAREAQRLAERSLQREAAVQDMLVEILSVAVTADPEKLRQPDGFSRLLEAKFDELEARFRGRTADWLDLLEVISTRLPQYGDLQCSYGVGQRYLALLQSSHADPRRIGRAALNQVRVLRKLGGPKMALRLVNEALAQLPPGGDTASLRSALTAERDALVH